MIKCGTSILLFCSICFAGLICDSPAYLILFFAFCIYFEFLSPYNISISKLLVDSLIQIIFFGCA